MEDQRAVLAAGEIVQERGGDQLLHGGEDTGEFSDPEPLAEAVAGDAVDHGHVVEARPEDLTGRDALGADEVLVTLRLSLPAPHNAPHPLRGELVAEEREGVVDLLARVEPVLLDGNQGGQRGVCLLDPGRDRAEFACEALAEGGGAARQIRERGVIPGRCATGRVIEALPDSVSYMPTRSCTSGRVSRIR